jgi:hypothetical protein
LISGPIENQQGGKHGTNHPHPHATRTHGKESAAKPEAKQNHLEGFGTYRIEGPEEPQVYANQSVQRPCRQEAKLAQNRKDRGEARRISKRQNRLDPTFAEDLEACSVKERRQRRAKEHQQREFRLDREKVSEPKEVRHHVPSRS